MGETKVTRQSFSYGGMAYAEFVKAYNSRMVGKNVRKLQA